jgi:hypothetical protein
MSEPKHTPIPWRIGYYNAQKCTIGIVVDTDAGEDVVAEVCHHDGYLPGEFGEANAAFIVRACNSHDALLAACRRLLDVIDEYGLHDHAGEDIGDVETSAARAAIAEAEGQP